MFWEMVSPYNYACTQIDTHTMTVFINSQGSKSTSLDQRAHAQVYWQLFQCIDWCTTMCTHQHRVVGLWDNQKRFLKCYSVRPARGKEEECAGEFVRASDHSMRETVATAHEN